MTPEEITQKIVNIASDTLTETPIYPKILEVIREAQRKSLNTRTIISNSARGGGKTAQLIKEAQHEAVEKTKQACWDFFLNFGVGCFTPTPDEQEYLILDNNYDREE